MRRLSTRTESDVRVTIDVLYVSQYWCGAGVGGVPCRRTKRWRSRCLHFFAYGLKLRPLNSARVALVPEKSLINVNHHGRSSAPTTN